ncbi:MAG: ParA family protein [Anaerolineae bacterium]|nr:ParA family protein [Anaerolineae bacterium]MDW8068190.1 ParA family protein [Anaerolineae bacterium]
MTTIMAIGNSKGGVAKTTTCLSLGAAFAELGQTVLLIDLDPQAHLTLSLGFHPERLRYTVSEVLLGHLSLVGASRETHIFGVDLIPANLSLAVMDKVLYRRPGYEGLLKQQFSGLKEEFYNYVLIDCPPASGLLTLNALTAADLLIIPLQCDYYAARALRQTIGLAKLVRERTNPKLRYRVLITMYDRRSRISRLVMEHMQQHLGHLLLNTVIEIDTRLRECVMHQHAINRYAPKSRSAEQYRALAAELMSIGRGAPAPARSKPTPIPVPR